MWLTGQWWHQKIMNTTFSSVSNKTATLFTIATCYSATLFAIDTNTSATPLFSLWIHMMLHWVLHSVMCQYWTCCILISDNSELMNRKLWNKSHSRSFSQKNAISQKPSAKINSEWQMSSIWHFPWHGCHFPPFLIYYTFYMKTYIKTYI